MYNLCLATKIKYLIHAISAITYKATICNSNNCCCWSWVHCVHMWANNLHLFMLYLRQLYSDFTFHLHCGSYFTCMHVPLWLQVCHVYIRMLITTCISPSKGVYTLIIILIITCAAFLWLQCKCTRTLAMHDWIATL